MMAIHSKSNCLGRIRQTRFVWIMAAMLLCMTGMVHAEIYKWTDEQGRTHFGDVENERYNAEAVTVEVNSYESVTYSFLGKAIPGSEKVQMFSTETCVYCKKAKNYFKSKGIAFVEYDIEKDAAAKRRYDALGGKGVPVILVGTKRMNGFSVSGFERIYP
jgi:glutaredoxin